MAKRGRPRHPDILTPREWEVLALLREGLTNEQIAERLGTTERTARFHVSEILGKLGVSTRQEAAAWEPEEERRAWWMLLLLSLKKAWVTTAVATLVFAALVASLAVVLWGISRTHGDPHGRTAVLSTALRTEITTAAVSSMSVGQNHACLVKGGMIYCWGRSYDYSAVEVLGIRGQVTTVATGNDYSCALLQTGAVHCWGANDLGQLGNGLVSYRDTPPAESVPVQRLTDATAVSAGANHTCALLASGGVKCWGDNTYGQLGDGTTMRRPSPVDVAGLQSGVRAVSVGGNFTCALMNTGAVECWGSNAEGQLAAKTDERCGEPGFVFPCTTQPRAVEGLSASVAVIAASPEGQHACAITTAQQLKCWGTNLVGQLGMKTTQTCSSPTSPCATTPTAMAVGPVSSVALGMYHTCAAEVAGNVKCWGDNVFGELGDGTTVRRFSPVRVQNITGVVSLGAGQLNTCALTADQQVLCWGADSATGTGVPSTEKCGCSTSPVKVYGLSQPGGSTPVDELVWYHVGDRTIAASTSSQCGDTATAAQYLVPRELTADGNVRLGLEAQPYPYVAAQVSSSLGQGRKPVGWEIRERLPLYFGFRSTPQGVWVGPTELFLRRLDAPDQMFRYSVDFCKQDGDFRPFGQPDLDPKIGLKLPPDVFLPKVVEHEHGDYISAQEAISIAEREESRALAGYPSPTSSEAIDLKGERVVWAELAKNDELSIPNAYTPRDVLWLIVFRLDDTAGPLRPGNVLGRYYVLYAKDGAVQQYGACCVGLEPSH